MRLNDQWIRLKVLTSCLSTKYYREINISALGPVLIFVHAPRPLERSQKKHCIPHNQVDVVCKTIQKLNNVTENKSFFFFPLSPSHACNWEHNKTKSWPLICVSSQALIPLWCRWPSHRLHAKTYLQLIPGYDDAPKAPSLERKHS